jgi:hypothetical protein
LYLIKAFCSAEPASSATGRERIKHAEISDFSAEEQTRTMKDERITKPLLYR